MATEKILRRGIVSAVYPERHSARVTFEDEDNLVSAELPILTTFASKNNFYALPDISEQVICLYEENDGGEGTGVIIGSIYSDVNKPKANSQDICRVDFGENFIEANRATGNLNIKFKGDITINGKNIYLN